MLGSLDHTELGRELINARVRLLLRLNVLVSSLTAHGVAPRGG